MHFISTCKLIGFCIMVLGTAFSNSFTGIGLGIYAGALAIESVANKHIEWGLFPHRNFLLALLASLLVSTFISHYLWVSLNGLGKHIQSFLIVFAAMDVFRCSGKQKVALAVFSGAFVLAAVAGLSQQVFGADLLRGHAAVRHFEDLSVMRLTGSFKHPNDYGSFLIAGFPLCLAGFVMAYKAKNRASSTFWLLLLAALTYLLMRTISRGAILSASVAVLVFGMAFKFRWKVLAAVAVAFLLIWLIPSPIQDRFHDMILFRGSSQERLLLMDTSIRMIRSSPFFGLGLNTYSDYFPQFRPVGYKAYMYAHNSYLQMGTEMGLIGLALYLAFVLRSVGHAAHALLTHESSEHTRVFGLALIAGIAGLLVNCLFESCLQSTQLRSLFWALIGTVCAMAAYATTPRKTR